MTFIEFFDETCVENIYGCLAHIPDKVVLVGCSKTVMSKHCEIYRNLFLTRGYDVEFTYKTIAKGNISSIMESLNEIVEQNDDCYFDVTGGDDIYLVAIGMICGKYPEKNIRIHRFNVKNGAVNDCDLDGETIAIERTPSLTVEESIKIYGGSVVYDDVKPCGTFRWDINDEFKKDIDEAWIICCANPSRWNVDVTFFGALDSFSDKTLGDSVISVNAETVLEKIKKEIDIDRQLLIKLSTAGLLSYYEVDKSKVYLKFKNSRVKRMLTNAGRVLELKVYSTGLDLCEKKGEKVYNDALSGVYIDWDGKANSVQGPDGFYVDAENEIDVILMHGIVPVFISCKNGKVDKDELYKLNSVAMKFGGKHVKKVIITTGIDPKDPINASFVQRTKEMEILHLGGVGKMDDKTFVSEIKTLWNRNVEK